MFSVSPPLYLLFSSKMSEEDYSEVNPFGSVSNPSPSNSSYNDSNTNLRLCSVLLNSFNYLHWSRAVALALGGKSKLDFIYGTIEEPEVGSNSYRAWISTDQLVRAWLINSMEPKLAQIFSYSSSASQLRFH